MEMPVESKKQQAFRKATDQFQRAEARENNFRAEQAKVAADDAAKTARLRGLRLAKEAADREAADVAPSATAEAPAKAKRKTRKITVS